MLSSTGVRAALRQWLADGAAPVPADGPDAGDLIEAAAGQGVAGRLDHAVRHDPRWPAPARERLHALARALLRRGVWQLELTERVRGLLAARGWRTLPLKGAALSEWLYASPAERAMADVDLLVLDDWHRARELLLAEGFEAGERADHAWGLRDPASGLTLELHRALTSCPRLHRIDAEGLWARSVAAPGLVARRPSDEDLLVQLALHASFQHGLVLSLGQWLDLRLLLARGALDPARLTARADEAGARTALALTLNAAGAVLAAPLPPAFEEAGLLAVPPSVRRWLARRLARPLDCVSPTPAPLARVRWALAAGRRLTLLADTLWPQIDGAPARPGWRRALAGGGRAVRLARHWF
jgi:hypothetical protein